MNEIETVNVGGRYVADFEAHKGRKRGRLVVALVAGGAMATAGLSGLQSEQETDSPSQAYDCFPRLEVLESRPEGVRFYWPQGSDMSPAGNESHYLIPSGLVREMNLQPGDYISLEVDENGWPLRVGESEELCPLPYRPPQQN